MSMSAARRAVGLGLVVASLALPGLAFAADPAKAGPDQLTLQDGTVVTGTFSEFIPNNRVTVLVNGESKTYQWSFMRKATHDGKVVAENQPQAALPPPVVVVQPQPQQQVVVVQGQTGAQAAPQAALEESVLVHMEGDSDAVLEMQDRKETNAFSPVCNSPCNKVLPLDRMYRITGDGMKDSRPFKLSGSAGQAVSLDVNPGRRGAFAGGIVMTVLGPITLLTGSLVYLVGAAQSSLVYSSSSGFRTSGDGSGLKVTGGILMIAGAALTAVGIPLIVSNARTKVTQDVSSPVRKDGFLRTPTFRNAANDVPMPATSEFTVFARSF